MLLLSGKKDAESPFTANLQYFSFHHVLAAILVSLCAACWQPACLLLVFKLQQLNWDDTLTGFLL